MDTEETGGCTTVRTVLGIALIVTAAFLAGWVVLTIYQTIAKGEKPIVMNQLLPAENEQIKITSPAGDFVFPDIMFRMTAYLVLFLLLSITAAISMRFLKAGIYIMAPPRHKATPPPGQNR